MSDKLQVIAKNEKKATKKAYKIYNKGLNEDVAKDDIGVIFVSQKKYLFGLITRNRYDVFIKDDFEQEVKLDANSEVMEEKESVDGDFSISVEEDGIFLEVIQPRGSGELVKMEEVDQVLDAKKIEDIDYSAVSEALSGSEPRVKIAERRPELDSDAKLNINIENDGMKAYLDFEPALGGQSITLDEVFKLAEQKGIVYGMNKEELEDIFTEEETIESFLLAEGKEPTSGKDAEIELKFDPQREDNKVTILEDGSVDYYNLNRIINVKEGDLLAKKIAMIPGEVGKKVTGEVLEAPEVNDIELPVGENTKLTEDGLLLLATIEGQVLYNEGEISVLDSYIVNGDVDLSTGNIEFEGNIIIKGNVTDNMKVEAEGNIEVKGSVYAAELISKGQIMIKQGFVGRNKGRLEAKGNIDVEFIENGKVRTEASLRVKNAIMHSEIDVDEAVKVLKGKGLIVGGDINATELIEAKIIGSDFDTSTKVAVGITPKIREEYEDLEEQYNKNKEQLTAKLKNLNLIRKKKDAKEELIQSMRRDQMQLASELEEVKKEYNKLKEIMEEEKDGKIIVHDKIYSGVLVTIGSITRKMEDDIDRAEIFADEAEKKINHRAL